MAASTSIDQLAGVARGGTSNQTSPKDTETPTSPIS